MSIGDPIDRLDGPAKVTGRAKYSAEWAIPEVTYGVLVMSRIASGRIAAIDTTQASHASGVIAVLTHQNVPRLPTPDPQAVRPVLTVLQDDAVWYQNQPVALVVGDTLERASDAASLVHVRYETSDAVLDMDAALDSAFPPSTVNGEPADSHRGDAATALAAAPMRVEQTYSTPMENHNPMEPHATIAVWDESGDRLTLYSSTQGVWPERRAIATRFGLPLDHVRVITTYLGGGFGCKGAAWSHVVLAALAAKYVKRPVKLVLERGQMYGPVGHRPRTVQRITLGATRDGILTAVRHEGFSQTSRFDDWVEPVAITTRSLYACPNVETSHRIVRVNAGTPWYMRAPGEATGLFALESAIDELAYSTGVDPLELRLRNYAETDQDKQRPWSSKSLRECYHQAADRFGWSGRNPEPRSMRSAGQLIGQGMATAARPVRRSAAAARVRMLADGSVILQSGTQDIGTGTYTIMPQIVADTLQVPIEAVRFDLGDTDLPETPVSAGSLTAPSTGSAVYAAAQDLRQKLIALATGDPDSPLRGVAAGDIEARDGQLVLRTQADRGEPYRTLLTRLRLTHVDGEAQSKPGPEENQYSMYGFGAAFAEVHVDPDLGTVHLTRFVGAYSGGRVLNAKTARSQLIGAIVYATGMALMEQTIHDMRTGRPVNADLAEYHVPVEADIPDIDVWLVPEHDPYVNPLGVKGLGELGMTGAAGAIANAVFHATGVRVRELPITLDKLFLASSRVA